MPSRRLNPLPALVRALPARQLSIYWIAIFTTFSSLGFVFDARRNELGFDWAKGVLQSSANQPLSAIADRLLAEPAPTAANSTIRRSC
jgi:hypothetical protein